MNFQIVVDALTQIVTDIINFIPDLINGLIIFLVGYLVSRLVRAVLSVVLRRIGFDPLVESSGFTSSLRGIGIQTPMSQIVAQTVYLLLLLSFLITATRLMGLEAVARLLEQLLTFLPNAIAALIIFSLGGIVAQFVGNLITTLGRSSGLNYASRVGRLVQYLITLFVVVLALGQLGVDTAILVTAITIMIAAFGLALGLALGLGARSIVHHVLAGYYLRQRFNTGQQITVDQISGTLGNIGGVNTSITTSSGAVIVPNTRLLENTVQAPQAANE